MSSAVICLLLVKDGSNDIPAWLRSVDPLADAVIALDDGSTDDTIAVLSANPLVQEVLASSPSRNELGHDGVNRNRLLAAASTLEPEWIVFLDVEELLDEEDAIVLRQFLRVDAIPGFAYGLHQYRMWTDEKSSRDLYDPEGRYIYRVFAHDPTYRVPEKHHPHPVPREIPPDRWMPTTVRVRHYGACTFQRLQSRLERMDLDRRRTGDFAKLDSIPNISLPGWQPRQSGLPVLIDVSRAKPAEPAILDPEAPTFSVVILVGDDADTLTTRVGAVIDQECDEPFEVIIIVNGNRTFADESRHIFSTPPTSDQVRIIELKEPTPLGRMKNVGLAAARGDYIIFVEPEIVLAPGSLDCRRLAHLRGYGMVGGALQNGNGAPAGWASYFLDQGAALPGRPAGEVGVLQGHWSYATIALRSVHGFAEHLQTGEDTVVNIELTRRGHRAWFEPAALAITHPASRRPSQLLRHQFIQGRGLARHAAVGGRPRVVEAWGRMRPAERMQRIETLDPTEADCILGSEGGRSHRVSASNWRSLEWRHGALSSPPRA
jgi:glycosyltransferase involved in cell wall biosynthesis